MDKVLKKDTFKKLTNIRAVIDTETTGLIAGYHEMIQLAIIPINHRWERIRELTPFILNLKPDYPERIDPKAMTVNKKMAALADGIEQITGVDLFESWYEKVEAYCTINGYDPRLQPLGQNYGFDRNFIAKWMGDDLYAQRFHYHYRDTLHSALYINDHAVNNGNEPPFQKVSLTDLATALHVPFDNAHDAVADCMICLEVYKKLLSLGTVPTL